MLVVSVISVLPVAFYEYTSEGITITISDFDMKQVSKLITNLSQDAIHLVYYS